MAYMVNPSNGDLDLARECESNLSLQINPQENHRVSIYLPPRAPNSKEIKFKTFPPLFLVYGIFGQHLPREESSVARKKKVSRLDIYGFFRGR